MSTVHVQILIRERHDTDEQCPELLTQVVTCVDKTVADITHCPAALSIALRNMARPSCHNTLRQYCFGQRQQSCGCVEQQQHRSLVRKQKHSGSSRESVMFPRHHPIRTHSPDITSTSFRKKAFGFTRVWQFLTSQHTIEYYRHISVLSCAPFSVPILKI